MASGSTVLDAFVARLEAGWLTGTVNWDAVLRLDDVRDAAQQHDPSADGIRAWICADWLTRVRVPAWLALAGHSRRARAIRRLAPLRDVKGAEAAGPALAAARAVCAHAERKAEWDAPWSARFDAATRAARGASLEVASAPIWLGLRDAANFAPWGVARDAIGDVVWECTMAVAWDAAWDAEGDGRDAARAALEPTALELEQGALELLESLVAIPFAAHTT